MEKGTMRGIGIGLIAGAVIGAGLGLLYAPHSGKKTRKEIMDRAEDFGDEIKKRAEKMSNAIGDSAEKYRKKIMDSVS